MDALKYCAYINTPPPPTTTTSCKLSYSSVSEDQEEEMADEATTNCIDILLAILLPPLGVFLKFGCQVEFWICLVLTFFGYIPGIIYAVYAITK
ncbi:hydrophobic protein LTI6B-like [Benincasa hispida]|uniref:hydrophobic protein LTI6B-like n=1 Tax=Benincasa hispida TaxID=102211 RepID=UPI0018FF5D6F|nr:hydrophobic protein LTI6B-like [Benincasa hispida]